MMLGIFDYMLFFRMLFVVERVWYKVLWEDLNILERI